MDSTVSTSPNALSGPVISVLEGPVTRAVATSTGSRMMLLLVLGIGLPDYRIALAAQKRNVVLRMRRSGVFAASSRLPSSEAERRQDADGALFTA
jgi:hypothetical protein